MSVPPKLDTFPREILDRIAIALVNSTFLGPPADLLALSYVSKSISRSISRDENPHLYAQIFFLKFDARAVVRRLGDDCGYATELADELVKRFKGLKRLRSPGVYPRSIGTDSRADVFLREDLWMAYLMFIESDGKNARQLIHYARVDIFASNFFARGGRIHDGFEENGGWIVDNEPNALATWLFWFTDKERIHSETHTERQNILQAFAHVFVGSFKYASTHAPITSFRIPPITIPVPPAPTPALPLAGSPLSTRHIVPDHFGIEVPLACPLFTPAALLISVVRLEAASAEMTLPVSPEFPETRAEAIATGKPGPTWEDYEDHKQVKTKLMEWEGDDGTTTSERHEHDWLRLLTCYDPWRHPPMRGRVFTPGMLDGVWVGRWFGIQMNEFPAIHFPEQADQLAPAPRLPLIYPVPMQIRIREHHQHTRNDVVDFDDMSRDGRGKGVFNAWLPDGTTMAEIQGELQVIAPNTIEPHKYRTYDPAVVAEVALDEELTDAEYEGLYGHGVWDILLTGETEDVFGDAWGHKRYHGRVRAWDGLVVLVREAVGEEAQWIFRGYVHGDQNLVGRWRETTTPVDLPGYEGVWSMTKREGL